MVRKISYCEKHGKEEYYSEDTNQVLCVVCHAEFIKTIENQRPGISIERIREWKNSLKSAKGVI